MAIRDKDEQRRLFEYRQAEGRRLAMLAEAERVSIAHRWRILGQLKLDPYRYL
jgi:hypothetical protein